MGTSEFLFPAPIRELRKVCDETGTKILYDAAHVSGLIAGQTFQNPLTEGADVLSMSTNKTLAAPDHGLVACNDYKIFQKRIERAVVPLFTSNHHAHHVAGLAITLAEFEQFGQAYATQVIKNAQVLAKALYDQGLAVLCPHKNFTQSHTVLFDAVISGNEAMKMLEQANIITNPFQLPWNHEKNSTGMRIGTNEVTRLGMKEKEMKIIAEFMAAVLLKRKKSESIRRDIIEFRQSFQNVQYCFNSVQNYIH
ncbi:DegT/DnrJ/EryC1/StrS family aminotransferase [Candidatus Gottesmanbacteria bacterium]|nr:DegT/DnrJ/EryC1/StrS family aminotransferase [Candidatus Gottesmanbacteria bacterium]